MPARACQTPIRLACRLMLQEGFRRRERFGITCAGALPGQTWKPTWFGNDALLGKSPEVKEAASWDGSLSESQMI